MDGGLYGAARCVILEGNKRNSGPATGTHPVTWEKRTTVTLYKVTHHDYVEADSPEDAIQRATETTDVDRRYMWVSRETLTVEEADLAEIQY